MPTTNPVPSTDPSDLLFNAGKLDEVVNGAGSTYTDRLGVTRRTLGGIDSEAETRMDAIDAAAIAQRDNIQDAADLVLAAAGYAPPVSYAAGISLTLQTQTVSYNGDTYAPKQSELPFTTSGTFETAKFRLIQGVASADLPALVGQDLQDYAALRAYTGQAKRIYITGLLVTAKPAGIAGIFQNDQSDTTSADNGGTIIVSADGRRWKRDFTGAVNVKWFGAKGDWDGTTGTDDSTSIQAAINFLNSTRNNGITGLGLGELYIPNGSYLIGTTLTATAGGLALKGDASGASELVCSAGNPTLFYANKWVGFFCEHIGFVGDNVAYELPAIEALIKTCFSMNPVGGGTWLKFSKCQFTGFGKVYDVLGTVNADTFSIDSCRFDRNHKVWVGDNSQAVIHQVTNCIFGYITGAVLSLKTGGRWNFDSCNSYFTGSMVELTPATNKWSNSTIFTFTNCKWEWGRFETNTKNCRLVKCDTSLGGTDNTIVARFIFIGCGLNGGRNAADTNETVAALKCMELSGACSVHWIGGNLEGAIAYQRNISLNGSYTSERRVEIVFKDGAIAIPPSQIVFLGDQTSGKSEPVIAYENCRNMPDMEYGGTNGYRFRKTHVLKFNPYPLTICETPNGTTNNYTVNIAGVDIAGNVLSRNAIIKKLFVMLSGATAAGTKTLDVYSDSARTIKIGTGSTTATAAGTLLEVTFTSQNPMVSGQIYLTYTNPVATYTTGYYWIEYVCVD